MCLCWCVLLFLYVLGPVVCRCSETAAGRKKQSVCLLGDRVLLGLSPGDICCSLPPLCNSGRPTYLPSSLSNTNTLVPITPWAGLHYTEQVVWLRDNAEITDGFVRSGVKLWLILVFGIYLISACHYDGGPLLTTATGHKKPVKPANKLCFLIDFKLQSYFFYKLIHYVRLIYPGVTLPLRHCWSLKQINQCYIIYILGHSLVCQLAVCVISKGADLISQMTKWRISFPAFSFRKQCLKLNFPWPQKQCEVYGIYFEELHKH